MQTIEPSFMDAPTWTSFMVPILEIYGNLGSLDNEENWRGWAVELMNLPQLSGSVVPDPYQFDDWRAWAQRFNENLSVIET